MYNNLSYLFLEIAVFITIYIIAQNFIQLKEFLNKVLISKFIVLIFFWFIIDQIAIHLNLWSFPTGKTLNFRFFNLPLEEYTLFLLHSIVCYMLIKIFRNE